MMLVLWVHVLIFSRWVEWLLNHLFFWVCATAQCYCSLSEVPLDKLYGRGFVKKFDASGSASHPIGKIRSEDIDWLEYFADPGSWWDN